MILPDVIQPGLQVIFCGTAVGEQSAARGAYYAGPGNRFWDVLYKTGLTPIRLKPQEYPRLTNFCIGLTDLNKVQSGNDDALVKSAVDVGGLFLKIRENRPGILAFNGKKAAQLALNKRSTVEIGYGRQPGAVEGIEMWVLPSTSRAANGSWDLSPWLDLSRAVAELRTSL